MIKALIGNHKNWKSRIFLDGARYHYFFNMNFLIVAILLFAGYIAYDIFRDVSKSTTESKSDISLVTPEHSSDDEESEEHREADEFEDLEEDLEENDDCQEERKEVEASIQESLEAKL